MHLMRKKVAAVKICAAWKKHLKARAEKKLREEAEERHEKEVADEIIRIADSVDQERKNRLDGEEAILKRLNDEVYRLTDMIAHEQQARKELEAKMMKQMARREKKNLVEINHQGWLFPFC